MPLRLILRVALRHLLGRKHRGTVNSIAWAVMLGIAVSCFAVVVVFSVFNGITSLVGSLYTSLDTDIAIRSARGKGFQFNDSLRRVVFDVLPPNAQCGLSLQENALFSYGKRQHLGVMLGVDSVYAAQGKLADHCVQGAFNLNRGTKPLASLTTGMAYYLGASLEHFDPVSIYVPNRLANNWLNPSTAFRRKVIYFDAVISVNGDFDETHVVVPLSEAQALLQRPLDYVSAVHITIPHGKMKEAYVETLQMRLGGNYTVLNRWQQNESLYRTVRSERLAIVLILSLILLVAAFNLVGCISMVTIERQRQMEVLSWLGASYESIRATFLVEGGILSAAGTTIGVVAGLIVCWLQDRFDFVKFEGSGTFVVDAYPVEVHAVDVVVVLISGVLAGLLASWVATMGLRKRYVVANLAL